MRLKAKSKKVEDGIRLSLWLPKSLYWIRRVIARLRKKTEEQGVRLSEGDILRMALESYLSVRAEEEDFESGSEFESAVKPVGGKTSKATFKEVERRRSVMFKVEDEALLSTVDRIVSTKKSSGIDTSFSYELIRLAKNGYSREMVGHELDRKIVEDLLRKKQ